MIQSKVYSLLQKYLNEYLFGFDKNNLNIGIFSGHISLTEVNLKPDKLN